LVRHVDDRRRWKSAIVDIIISEEVEVEVEVEVE
jgi:hypothetical protein